MNNKKNKLSQEDVDHAANLARIEITDSEKENYSNQLSSIMGYIDKLNEVDTKNIEPVTHTGGLRNIMRADEAQGCNVQEDLIEAAPENENDMVKVKAILRGGKS